MRAWARGRKPSGLGPAQRLRGNGGGRRQWRQGRRAEDFSPGGQVAAQRQGRHRVLGKMKDRHPQGVPEIVLFVQGAEHGDGQGFLRFPGQLQHAPGHFSGGFPFKIGDGPVMEQHRVHLGVPAHRGHDVGVEGEIKDIAQVNGVVGVDHPGPGAGLDGLNQGLGQGRQGEAKLAAGIGGDHRLAAAAGEDHQAVAPNRGLVHQFDGVQELGLGLDPDDAALPAGGLQHPLIGGEGGGMRLGDGGRLRPDIGQMQVDGLGGLSGHLRSPRPSSIPSR